MPLQKITATYHTGGTANSTGISRNNKLPRKSHDIVEVRKKTFDWMTFKQNRP